MKRALWAVVATVICLSTVGCCCGRPCRPLLWWWPGRCLGCGDCYRGDYFEGRDCCEPCDGCGNWTGGGCGRAAWQSPPCNQCGGCQTCNQGGFENASYAPGYYQSYDQGEFMEMDPRMQQQPTPAAPRQSTRSMNPARMANMRRPMYQ